MRIALMLRGHARTWRWTVPALIDSLRDCTPNIDTYLCIWRSQTFGRRELHELCDMLPVVHAELTSLDQWDLDDSCDGYTAPGWQGARLAAARRRTESQGVQYDMVIDTRPDIFVETHGPWLSVPPQNHLLSTMVTDPWFGSHLPGMEDHLLVMDPMVHDIWCERHHSQYDIGYNHCILHQFCLDARLVVSTVNWLRSEFVRPNWHRWHGKTMDIPNLLGARTEWNGMTQARRYDDCIAAGIDPEEYSAPFHVGRFA